MKIKIENNGVKATVEIFNYTSDTATEKIAKMTSQLVADIHKLRNTNAVEPSNDFKVYKEQIAVPNGPEIVGTKEIVKIERPAFRDRLPNNIVDIKDLNIKQAITEKALVRCPNCGQAHCIAVNSGNIVYMMKRNFHSDDFNIIAEFDSITSSDFVNMCCKPETDRKAYFEDIQSISVINSNDFVINNESEIFCPVCNKSNTFYNWKKAFDEPLTFFETEHLCDVCGGEVVEKINKNIKTYICDSCGTVLDNDFVE